ncbi:MAG: glycine--tRNA ligase [Candidatus Methanofastidiosa archaeon]|nr:glycine--tRNA ligase [Candidatus Methanofastidiosa archaeon]
MKSDEIMDVALRRGFIFPSSEIYGGISGFYDYGHLGTLMRKKWENEWRRHYLGLHPNFFEIDATHIMPRNVFVGSGHLENFNDPLTECEKCHSRFRADHLVEEFLERSAEGMSANEMSRLLKESNIPCPKCGGHLLDVKMFNMMFEIAVGATGESEVAYLRPETAQGAFLAFKRSFNTLRGKLPMGLAIVGRAYRNEISPRQGFYRLREFNQAELQIFFDPDTIEEHPEFDTIKDVKLRMFPLQNRSSGEVDDITASDLNKNYGIPKFYIYHLAKIQEFYLDKMNIPRELFRFRELSEDERAFYNKIHWDVEVYTESLGGYKEMGGLHYRTDHDLGGHQNASGERLDVNIDGKKFVPHVLELSFGVDRNFWTLLDIFYKDEGDRKVISLPKEVAPFRAGVFPLQKKEDLEKVAKTVYDNLRQCYDIFYDDSGSIGRRYRRQDEIGTPYGITIDFQTLEDNTVTIRERDSMNQHRVKIEDIWKNI